MNSVLQNLCYLAKFNVARRYLCESQGMAGYSSGCNLPKANKIAELRYVCCFED